MRTHLAVFILGVVLGFALLTATNGLAAPELTPAEPVAVAQMEAATPAANDAAMAEQMEQMMDQCTQMKEMMTMMMGMMGDDGMAGMMGGEEMPNMAPAAGTPAA